MLIANLADLKAEMASPSWFETLQEQEQWLPELVRSLAWETRLSIHILLHIHIDWHDETDSLFDHLLNDLEQIYRELVDFFQIRPQSKQEQLAMQARLNLFFVKTQTNRVFGSLTDPHLLFYFWDPKQHPDTMQKLRHELAHWVWGRLYGEAPALFQEGVADYAEHLSPRIADPTLFWSRRFGDWDDLPPLHELAVTENFWRYNGSYAAGGQFVAFLVERWGWSQLKELFLHSHYEDEQIAEHFARVYGQPLATVDQVWRAWLRSIAA